MRLILLIPLVWATCAQALVDPICLKAVAGHWNPNEAAPKEIQNVLTWIDIKLLQTAEYPLGVLSTPEFKSFLERRAIVWKEIAPEAEPEYIARFFFEQWQKWDDVNLAQRDAHLNLELDHLIPKAKERPQVLSFGGGYARLKEQSFKNRERLLSELKAKYPRYEKAGVAAVALADKFAARLSYSYTMRSKSKLTGNAPLVSPNALQKLDLNLDNPFYSSLVGGSNMVKFNMTGTLEGHQPTVIDDEREYDAFRLNETFARQFGMMLPAVNDATELIDFMSRVDAGLLKQVFERNRSSLPATVTTPEEFRDYLKPSNLAFIFPQEKEYDRLYPLRARLIDFVMSTEDGEAFLREAFRIYLMHLSVDRDAAFVLQTAELEEAGGFQNIFTMEFLPFIGWDRGIALQIPVSVPATEAPKIRIESWP